MINFTQKTLANGIRYVEAPLQNTEAVTILVLVGTGGRYEKADQLGISHFLEHLFFKGTKKRPSALKIATELDALGANYNAFTSEESTGFYIQSAARDFEKAYDLITDLFLNPIFPAHDFEREKSVIIEEANMRRDIPQLHVQVLSQKQVFGPHPLGEDLIGTPESVGKISRVDINNYYKTHYRPANTILAICGKKTADWEKLVNKTFAQENAPAPTSPAFTQNQIKQKVVFEKRQVDQTHFVLSALTFPKTDKRRWALTLLSFILGGGMSSRLFSEIREKRALGYYVKSDLNSFADTGALAVSAGVKKDRLNEAVEIVSQEIGDLAQNGPQAEELARAKSAARGNLAISLESSFEIAEYVCESLLYENQIRQSEEVIAQLNKVTASAIKVLAQEIFTSAKMGLAVIAPQVDVVGLTKIINQRS